MMNRVVLKPNMMSDQLEEVPSVPRSDQVIQLATGKERRVTP